MEAGIFFDCSEKLPFVSRWGTCTEEMGKEVAGMHFHQAFSQAARAAFPNWHAARVELAEPGRDADDLEARRQYIRSKTWRFVKVVTSPSKPRDMMLTCWVAGPLDHCNQRLQHLSAQRTVFDVLGAEGSPIEEAQKSFEAMIVEPLISGPLATYFWYYGMSDSVVNAARSLVVQMSGQLWYRFLDWDDWPLNFVRMVTSLL